MKHCMRRTVVHSGTTPLVAMIGSSLGTMKIVAHIFIASILQINLLALKVDDNFESFG